MLVVVAFPMFQLIAPARLVPPNDKVCVPELLIKLMVDVADPDLPTLPFITTLPRKLTVVVDDPASFKSNKPAFWVKLLLKLKVAVVALRLVKMDPEPFITTGPLAVRVAVPVPLVMFKIPLLIIKLSVTVSVKTELEPSANAKLG